MKVGLLKWFVGCFFLIGLLVLSCQSKEEEKMEEVLPNVVFIVSDDQSWTDYGFMGHAAIETPNIDRLLSEGTTYTRGYLTAPVCSPSLASIITGLYPHQHGVTGNDPKFSYTGSGPKYREEWLQERLKLNRIVIDNFKKHSTIPSLLKVKGYRSFQSGKWWGGSYKDGGFDEGMTLGDPEHGGRHGDVGLQIGREGMDPIYDFVDSTTANKDPFFVWYAPFLPHTPHNPPDSLLAKYIDKAPSVSVAKYWAMVDWFDVTVGQLLEGLEERGLTENTIIVYVSDNGWIQQVEKSGYEWPSKQSPYDMGMRSPISFKWPGHIPVKMDTSTFVSSTDLAPTVLALLDLEPTDEMMGVNILDSKAIMDRKAVYSEDYNHDILNVYEPTEGLEHRMMMKSPWKLILPSDRDLSHTMESGGGGNFIPLLDGPRLYHILTDVHEQYNVADQHPDLVKAMTEEMNEWWMSKN